MPEPDPFAAPVRIARPLSGVTILLVEDSRYCSEAVRLMALRSGARLRRADSIAAANRHLAMYRPDAIIMDIGLPDGSGLDFVADLRARGDISAAIIVMSGDGPEVAENALDAGADGFLPKPVTDLAAFQHTLEQVLERDVTVTAKAETPDRQALDRQALMDDIGRISNILEQALPEGDENQLRYCAQFVSSIAQTSHDGELADGASRFFRKMSDGDGTDAGRRVLDMLHDRLARTKADQVSGAA